MPACAGFEPVVQRGSLHYEEVGGEDRYVIAGVSTTGLGDYSWMVGLVVSNFKPGSLRRFAIFFEQREPCHAQRLDDLRVYLTNDKRMSASRLIIVNAQELACACTSAAGPRMALPAELVSECTLGLLQVSIWQAACGTSTVFDEVCFAETKIDPHAMVTAHCFCWNSTAILESC